MKPPPRSLFPLFGTVLALSAAALVLFIPRASDRLEPLPRLQLVMKRDGKEQAVRAEGALRAGDVLRVFVDPAGAAFVAVVVRSTDGALRVVYPGTGDQSAALGEAGPLPFEWTLREERGPLRVVGVFSDRPLPLPTLISPGVYDDPILRVEGVRGHASFHFSVEAAPVASPGEAR